MTFILPSRVLGFSRWLKTKPIATDCVSRQPQFEVSPPQEFSKDDVDGNYIGIEAVDSGAIHQIVLKASHVAIPGARYVVGGEPPQKIQKARAGQSGNAVPCESRWVQILDALAVDMGLKIIGHMGQPLDHRSLCPVALI